MWWGRLVSECSDEKSEWEQDMLGVTGYETQGEVPLHSEQTSESLGLETKTDSLPFQGKCLQTWLWRSFWYPGVPFNGFVNSVDIWNKNQQLVVIFLLYILIDKLQQDLKSIRIRMIHTELELRDLFGLLFSQKTTITSCQNSVLRKCK